MLRLLKIEWNKIYYYKTARIFTILYFISLILIGVILANLKPQVGGVRLDITQLGFFEFPVVWSNLTYLVAIMKIFIAVIIITNVTNEYSNRTLKQNLIDGLSKNEFLKSKLWTNFIFAIFSTLFVFGISLVLGWMFSKSQENIFKGIEYILAYFIKLNFFFTFCLFLAILFRKSAFALLGFIVWWMIEVAISTAEVLIHVYIDKGVSNLDKDGFYFSNYLPLNASSKLIDFPRIELGNFIQGEPIIVFRELNWGFLVVVVIYMLIFVYLNHLLLKKRDL